MPEITRFYGIVIKMFFKPKEHEPSHIHALYGEYVGIFDLKTLKMTKAICRTKHRSLLRNGCFKTKMNFSKCGKVKI